MLLLLSCITVITALFYYYVSGKSKCDIKLPPGPRGIPILGNLHQLGGNASDKLSQWAQKYGKLYTIHLGSTPALVVNDAVTMRYIFGLPASTGKFHSEVFNVLFGGPYGILNTGGAVWAEQRTFLLKAMKAAAFGKTSTFEPLIMEKLADLCEWIKRERCDNGKIYFNEVLKRATGSIIWTTMTEETKETEISVLLEDFMQRLEKVSKSGLAFFSWIKCIAPNMSGYNDYTRASVNLQEFVKRNFEDPRRKEGRHKDLLYKYQEHAKSVQEDSSFYGEEGQKQCIGSLQSLLMGGSETTATTMNFFIFYMCAHPEIQAKVQKEIAEVGRGRSDICLEDRKRMPYTEAVIEETLRFAITVPLGIMHVLLEDVSIFQYKLPKDMILIANIHHALSDPGVWETPNEFKPERFLEDVSISSLEDEVASSRKLKESVVAFQPGKRICPGEQLARDMLFLFTTKLCKTFTFSMEAGRRKEEYLERVFSSIQMPNKLPVVAICRE